MIRKRARLTICGDGAPDGCSLTYALLVMAQQRLSRIRGVDKLSLCEQKSRLSTFNRREK
jgi:hypothetical protein